MRWMRERLTKDEGFTLIELMVVVLIIAVLVAIAIPSFLGFRSRAQDRSAQSDLRNVLLSEKAAWTDNATFTTTEATLKGFEPSIEINVVDSDTEGVFVEVDSVDEVCLTQASASKNYFAIYENAVAAGGTFYGASAADITCPTANPATTATVNWSSTGFPAVP